MVRCVHVLDGRHGMSKWKTLIGIGALAGAAGIWWARYSNTPAEVRVPEPDPTPRPEPNGFYCFVEASRIVEGLKASESGELVPAVEDSTPQQRQEVLRVCAPALAKLREGLAQESRMPLDVTEGDVDFPAFTGFRDLARLLRVESCERMERADYGGAIASALDAVQLGIETGRGGLLIHFLVGEAVGAIGAVGAFGLVNGLSPQQARTAAVRAYAIAGSAAPVADVVRAEMRYSLRHLSDVLTAKDWRRRLLRDTLLWDSDFIRPRVLDRVSCWTRVALSSPKAIAAEMEQSWDDLLTRVSVLLQAAKQMPESRFSWMAEIAQGCIPTVPYIGANRDLRLAFLYTALALRAWQQEHGRYPESLEDLVPELLPSLPDDPYSIDQPLRYQSSGDRYTLYSIGPDGIDDGGKAYRAEDGFTMRNWHGYETVKGDLVLDSAELPIS